MKKIIILFILLLSGCSVNVLKDDNNFIVDTLIKNNLQYYNTIGLGYKYYLPNNVRVVSQDEYNDILYSNGYKYYLYIDVTSYYYKSEIKHNVNSNLYYNKKLDKGYIEITKNNNDYFIKYYYNYSYIEANVEKQDIKNTLIDMSYILSSIKYNDKIIGSIKTNKTLYGEEEYFKLDSPKKKSEQNYLNYKNVNAINDIVFGDIVDTDFLNIIEE